MQEIVMPAEARAKDRNCQKKYMMYKKVRRV
jgi:hypothetical protein